MLKIIETLTGQVAKAALLEPGGLVPQPDGGKYTFCHLLDLVENVLNAAVEIAFVLGVIMAVCGGFVIMTAGGSEDRVKKGKDALKSVAIGLGVVLVAWIALSTIVQILGGADSLAPWHNLTCEQVIAPESR